MTRYNWYSFDLNKSPANPKISPVKYIIIVNVSVYLLIHLFSLSSWVKFLGMTPGFILTKFTIWQFVSYMFIHVGLWHLALNMLMLWFFGPALENTLGRKEFLTYYFFTGIGAGFCSFLFSLNSYVPVIGASGAIFGLLVAYAYLFPEATILLFFVFPVKMRQGVVILAAINLLGGLSNPGSGIAYFAHLGGALFGYIYLKSPWLKEKLNYIGSWDLWKKSYRDKLRKKQQRDESFFAREIDRILDKISAKGINSLTKREKSILEEHSKRIN